MNDTEVRFACLQLISQPALAVTDTDAVIAAAQKLYDFVKGDDTAATANRADGK